MVLAVVRVGGDGTAAAAGPEVQSGALHLEGAPGGLHHATRLHRGGMIGFQTEHGPHAATLTTETLGKLHHLPPPLLRIHSFPFHHQPQRQPSWCVAGDITARTTTGTTTGTTTDTYIGRHLTDEGHDPRLIATAATAPGLLSGALLQLDLAVTDLTDLDRVPQIAQIVAMTVMARARITGSAHLPGSERSLSPLPSRRAQTPARASHRPALARAALIFVLDHVRQFRDPQLA